MGRPRKIQTMAELQAALQAAFNAINRDFYNGELEKVIITCKESRKPGAVGTFCCGKEWIQNGKKRHELNISADYIGTRTVEETITTLMHEMVHLYCCQNDIQDTSRSGSYHNKRFKQAAENHGLDIAKAPKIGWSVTKPKPYTQKWIKDNITIKDFAIFKLPTLRTAKGSTSKTKQSSRKYVCPSCGLIARLTKEAAIKCVDCDKVMIFES